MSYGVKERLKRKTARMKVLDRQLRSLAIRYNAYKGLFERAMDVIKGQAELIRYYADNPEEHSYFTRRMAELKQPPSHRHSEEK